MAKQKQDKSPPSPDTGIHAKPSLVGEYGKHNDWLIVPGEGLYMSSHAMHDIERDARKQHKARGKDDYSRNNYHTGFIDEAEIELWYKTIQTYKSMQEAERETRAEYEANCYPGTDTEDPTKDPTAIRSSRNDFELDRSKSSVHLTMASGQRFLNGSSVAHSNYVRLTVNSPDGRELVEVALTFDQFASMLVSSMETPCTVDTYWSVTDRCVRLQEVVKPPESVGARMRQRLDTRLDDMRTKLQNMEAELDAQIASGKPMTKTKLQELRKAISIYASHYDSNRDFTVLQAQEEVSSIVEQAAASIAWQHRLSSEELAANPHVQALVSSWLQQKTLALESSRESMENKEGVDAGAGG